MSNKDKMVAGRLYIASDPELVADRTAARKLVAEFNATTGRQAYLMKGAAQHCITGLLVKMTVVQASRLMSAA